MEFLLYYSKTLLYNRKMTFGIKNKIFHINSKNNSLPTSLNVLLENLLLPLFLLLILSPVHRLH